MYIHGLLVKPDKQRRFVGVKLTYKEKQAIQALVKSGDYMGEADFLRSAVREKLKSEELRKGAE